MARSDKPSNPWTRLALEPVTHKPYPIVRVQLRTHNGPEVTSRYVPGRRLWVWVLPITPRGTALLERQ